MHEQTFIINSSAGKEKKNHCDGVKSSRVMCGGAEWNPNPIVFSQHMRSRGAFTVK